MKKRILRWWWQVLLQWLKSYNQGKITTRISGWSLEKRKTLCMQGKRVIVGCGGVENMVSILAYFFFWSPPSAHHEKVVLFLSWYLLCGSSTHTHAWTRWSLCLKMYVCVARTIYPFQEGERWPSLLQWHIRWMKKGGVTVYHGSTRRRRRRNEHNDMWVSWSESSTLDYCCYYCCHATTRVKVG